MTNWSRFWGSDRESTNTLLTTGLRTAFPPATYQTRNGNLSLGTIFVEASLGLVFLSTTFRKRDREGTVVSERNEKRWYPFGSMELGMSLLSFRIGSVTTDFLLQAGIAGGVNVFRMQFALTLFLPAELRQLF